MLSIQTNVDSLIAQQNLNINNQFQSNTIQQLTSGYRINSAGDDAAGLAVANQYRDQIAELNQGVLNANDGSSQLQIMDGGLDNVSTMLDRLQTLATESASTTFTGNRSTLNNEYQSLLSEIDRQANNIGLGANNTSNIRNIGVYIGGGQDANTNSTVNVNLTNSGVGTVALGLSQTSVLTNAAVVIGGANAVAATKIAAGNSDTFNIQTANGLSTFTITGGANDTLQSQLNELNSNLQGLGIQATTNNAGYLQFQSGSAFSVAVTTSDGAGGTPTNLVSGTPADAVANNTGLNNLSYSVGLPAGGGIDTNLQVTVGGTTVTAALGANEVAAPTAVQQAAMVTSINQALQKAGVDTVTAVADASSLDKISFQGSTNFTVADDSGNASAVTDTFVLAGTGSATGISANAVTGGDPQVAIDAITAAIQSLGQTQGKIGAGENTLNYAINLAQSQITNFSSAQSQIRDANVAQEAANLTKAQVLQQTSIAAMAQANSAPQALLKLFQ
jgi:flagellin